RPFAWSGEMRVDPDTMRAPMSVSFSPFYVTLNVVKARGDRRAVASVVLDAAPPANRLTQSMDSLVSAAQSVASYDFAPVADSRGGPFVMAYKGAPLVRVIPRLATSDEIGFRRAAMLRARGTIALVILTLAFLVYAWRDRRAVGERLLAVAIAFAIAALVP